jgi:cystathionine beta-lyase
MTKPVYDFDRPIDRSGTASEKWDRYKGRGILPMWVADMDFASPPEVLEALHQRVDHGVFGYTHAPDELIESIRDYWRYSYDWQIEPQWLVFLPGLVSGLNIACRAVGEAGDAVMTAVPVYPPFLTAPGISGRELIAVPLKPAEEHWSFDFEQMAQAVTPRTKLFILCNPHNPVGRVFSKSELLKLVDFCETHDLILCSDEIHCDLILEPGLAHIPTATLGAAAARRCITLMAPSKTYNIAGLGCSFAVISDERLRRRFKAAMQGIVPHVNALALTAATAAYQHGEAWRQALIAYLRRNRDRVIEAIGLMPALKVSHVEATYLAWIDARAAKIDQPRHFFEAAGVGMNDGADFGAPGFVRLNFGCPAALLEQALAHIAIAMEKVQG